MPADRRTVGELEPLRSMGEPWYTRYTAQAAGRQHAYLLIPFKRSCGSIYEVPALVVGNNEVLFGPLLRRRFAFENASHPEAVSR